MRYAMSCLLRLRLHKTPFCRHLSKNTLSEAEKIVGYPTSFLNLRWLLSDEIANIAVHLRKLARTNHPLLQTAKSLLVPSDTPPWGLIILLVSKAAGFGKEFAESEHDRTSGVLHSQRVLAEVTEMIRTSNRLHKALVNHSSNTEHTSDIHAGNKIALLSGDYLLGTSYHQLACLKNQELNEIMPSALRDLVEADFLGPTDQQNRPLPSKPDLLKPEVAIPHEFGTSPLNVHLEALGNAKSEWMLRNTLGGASLLAKSCQGAFVLSGHTRERQELGFLFGRSLALCWQASAERNMFLKAECGPQCLVSAPVLFHLQQQPELYEEIEKGLENVEDVDFAKVLNAVRKGSGLERTEELQRELADEALEIIEKFEVGDAKEALRNIVNAM